MESLASETCSGSLKDRIAIKMDMVKPIPASSPTPIICFQLLPSGNELSLAFVHNKEVNKIPIGLPTNKPNDIPRPMPEVKPPNISFSKVILVFAKAKSGMIRKFTGLGNACSRRSNGDSIAVSLVGMVIATKTPAIVAWIPEWWKKYQINTPGIKYRKGL